MKKQKISKLYIAVFLYKFTFLLLALPLEVFILKNAAPKSATPLCTATAAILALLTLWSALLYKKAEFSESRSCFYSAKGLLLTRNTVIRKGRIHIRICTQKVPYLFFKAAELTLVTSRLQSSVYLNSEAAKSLTDTHRNEASQKEAVLSSPGFFATLLISAGFSNTLTGFLTLIPILRKAAALIGQSLPLELLIQLPLEEVHFFRLLPSSLRLLASLLLTLWLLGLAAAIQKLWGFRCVKSGNLITLSHGLLTKKRFTLHSGKISALSLRQNVLPYLLHLYGCVAYIPSEKGQKALPLALAKSHKQQMRLLSRLEFLPKNLLFSVMPRRDSLWGYLYLPYIYLVLVSLLCIFRSFLPISQLLYAAFLPLVIFGMGWVFFRFAGFRRTKLLLYENMFCVCGFKGFVMKESYLPIQNLRGFEIRESLFQKFRRRCTLKIYVKAATRLSFSIRHIDKEKATQLVSCVTCDYSLYSIKSEGKQ